MGDKSNELINMLGLVFGRVMLGMGYEDAHMC
jgi:hypothetical protein